VVQAFPPASANAFICLDVFRAGDEPAGFSELADVGWRLRMQRHATLYPSAVEDLALFLGSFCRMKSRRSWVRSVKCVLLRRGFVSPTVCGCAVGSFWQIRGAAHEVSGLRMPKPIHDGSRMTSLGSFRQITVRPSWLTWIERRACVRRGGLCAG
jgi:hypothetical protein